MKQFLRTALLWMSLLLCASAVLAQGWPLPARTPNTDVACSAGTSSNCGSGLLTKGWPSTPIVAPSGRYLDSNATGDYQGPGFRTARAYRIKIVGNRAYFLIGSGIGSYDLGTFFTRLAAGETLVGATQVPGTARRGAPEVFLPWDTWFYPQDETNSPVNWQCDVMDGQNRLFGIDVDDQGYVYAAYAIWGWGILKDSGGTGFLQMASEFQHLVGGVNKDGVQDSLQLSQTQAASDFGPYTIAAIKTSDAHYWAVVSDPPASQVWVVDVTNRTAPTLPRLYNVGVRAYAKTTGLDRIATIDGQDHFRIFTADSLVNGGRQTLAEDTVNNYRTVTGDGTNFYTTHGDSTHALYLDVWTPSAGGYSSTSYAITPFYTPTSMQYGAGFITLSGSDGLRLFKLAGLVPQEVPANVTIGGTPSNYFHSYYGYVGGGYAYPGNFSFIFDSVVTRVNGHYYLILAAGALGDVYEIKGADTISVSGGSATGHPNPKAPAGGPFYGDTMQWSASTSGTSAVNVNWNFGNGSPAGTTDATSSTGVAVTHQYSGLHTTDFTTSPSNSSVQVWNTTVTARNQNDATMAGTAAVQLYKPVPRFGVSNTQILFTSPNASSPAPIIAGDTFFDGSDGTVEGHYDSWNFGSSIQKTLPTDTVSVGQCGTQALSFDSHYGPYTGTADNYTSSGTDFAVGIHGSGYDFTYLVRPFAAAVSVSSDAINVTFTSGSRASATVITSTQLAALTWNWELVNSNGATVTTGPAGTGFASIQPWSVPKSTFAGPVGLKAHLVLTSPTDFSGACAGLTKSEAFSQALNAPDPVVTGGCTNGGPPCSFVAAPPSGSTSNPTADGWQYQWSVNPAAGVSATFANSSTFSPVFTTAGAYAVSCTITNAVGFSTTASKSVTATPPACGTIAQSDVFLNYSGPTSNCYPNPTSPSCVTTEAIAFNMQKSLTSSFDPTCGTPAYSWSFGDGGTSSSATPTHKYASAGPYTASLTFNNGTSSITLNASIPVTTGNGGGGGCQTNCGGSGGGGNTCGVMSDQTVFLDFKGATSNCSTSNATCQGGEAVMFDVQTSGYSLGCASHNITWDFGDGGSGVGGTVSHSYSSAGTYIVKMTVASPYQTYQRSVTLTVTAAPNTCGPITASNIDVGYSGASSGCATVNPSTPCATGEAISFFGNGVNYNFACGTHTYTWSFGDGASGSGANASHSYANQGTYTVTLQVKAPSGTTVSTTKSVTVTQQSHGGDCANLSPTTVFVNYANAGGTCYPGNANNVCSTNETINFSLQPFGYNFGCANHTYAWDFGDGGTATTAAPTHTYTATDTYTVKCTIGNGSQTTTVSSTIRINHVGDGSGGGSTPAVDFTSTPMSNVPNGWTFTPIESPDGIITKWVWDFGDTTQRTVTGTAQAPTSYVYATGGPHTVTLSGYTDARGLIVQVTHTIGVAERKRPVHH